MKKLPQVFIKDFQYVLPSHQIAHFPLGERDESRLLIYENGLISEKSFSNIPEHLPQGSTLVLNNSRVIEARILFKKDTGATIEIFCLEPAEKLKHTEHALHVHGKVLWQCLIGGASKWKHGDILEKELMVEGKKISLKARYVEKVADSFIIEFSWEPAFYGFVEILHAAGIIPLPPYIKRKPVEADAERYQTVFAKTAGSVAAPTAALHFTQETFDGLNRKNISTEFITLHVGAGTFKPVKTETIAEHKMHSEEFQVSINTLTRLAESKELIAVGTTSLRTLESIYWIGVKISKGLLSEDENITLDQWEVYELDSELISYEQSLNTIINFLKKKGEEVLFCHTSLIIVPGYKFYSAKALITNFHQPQSTLLLLVAAFIGDDWRKVYDYALENNFRFLSYGDSSLLWRRND